MSSSPVTPRPDATRGTELGARIEGLRAAVSAARGRLDDALLDEVAAVAERAGGRLRLSADHTVVAIAGATGSGKSSTYNALTGLELSSTGVRRPTTSWATACVWGSQGAEELLDWLGIPPRHQTMRESMLDAEHGDEALDGVVLLDLPDHDSTEVSHHLEVDRLVELADLLVWVVDPQKYADAAIHDRYLAPLRDHAANMVVVLNHIDTVPADRRTAMVDDVRRLLALDGLPDVGVFAVSARHGIGIEDLRGELRSRVAEKRLARERIAADLRAAAERLVDAGADARTREVPAARVARLEEQLADAAGVPVAVEGVERSVRARAGHATAWPPLALLAGDGADPAKNLDLDLSGSLASLRGSRDAAASLAPVQRSRVEADVRALADDVAEGMGRPWVASVQRASVARVDAVADRLDADLARVDLGTGSLPSWVGLVRVLQWLLLLAAVGGLGWTVALAVGGSLGDAPDVLGAPLPVVLAVAGLLLGIALHVASRGMVSGLARARAEEADERLRGVVHRVATELVVEPVGAELTAYATVRSGITAASR